MTRKPRMKRDPLEQAIELALEPGRFIADRACYAFVSDLEEVADRIAELIDPDPLRAAALYETFLAGCYEKVEEVDDSSGSLGQFVEELFCGWTRARQEAEADPDETASRLLAWMDDDLYGFCYGLEERLAKVLDKAGGAALIKHIRARFDQAATTTEDQAGADRRRWGQALRALYRARKNLGAYMAIAEESGITPADCHAIATLLVGRRKPAEAHTWVERGLELEKGERIGSRYGYELAQLERKLLTKLGRGNEALDAAWADFRKHPSKYTYDDLMKLVPKAERKKWHEQAMEAAKGGDLASLLELFMAAGEMERLADLIRRSVDAELEALSHYSTEPAAGKLEKKWPDLAARLWLAQGMRIIKAKKSKYYDAALRNFERAQGCFERAGLLAEWEKTVAEVRADHRRKSNFMPGFEALVAGRGPSREPSFLERAKARWRK